LTTTNLSKPKGKHHRYRLRFRPHEGQSEVHTSKARFRVVACGRQWGKTRYAAVWALKKAVAGQAGWWVAPDANVADIGWDEIKPLASQVPGAVIKDSYPRTVTFPSGGWLQVKGAHLPGKLRGRTLDFLVVDEAAFILTGERWNSELRPTLAIRGGEALFVSTFNGENWFYDLYELGQDENYPEWASWRKPSTENPYFPLEELELARATTPEAEFEQEYMANPRVYVGAVFPGEKVQQATERRTEILPELPKFAGLDWGYTNATAFEVCQEDTEGRITWFEECLWVSTQLETRVGAMVESCRHNKIEVVYADAAGADGNAMLAAHLEDAGLPTVVVKVPFNKYKTHGIEARRWFLEQDLETMSAAVPELIRTTKRYRYKEGTEDPLKEDDHPVDAATAFYASRRGALVADRG
jgi:hypothetical protein